MADPISDLSAGDATPKVIRASLKDLTLAVNRLSYTIKTPDTVVAPDALQISQDGNAALGGVPELLNNVGRVFGITNSNTTGNTTARLNVASTNGASIVSVQAAQNNVDSGFTLRDHTGAQIAKIRLDTTNYSLKFDSRNAGNTYTAMRLNNTGEFMIGDTSDVYAKFMVLSGTNQAGGQGGLYLQSTTPLVTPVIIHGAAGSTLQITAGTAVDGIGRGAQIDLASASASLNPSTITFRAGSNTDGLSPNQVGRFTALGRLGVGLDSFDPESTIHARAQNGVRGRVTVEGINDYAGFTARRSNGTYSSKTPILNGDELLFLNAHGWTSANTWVAGSLFGMTATEDWTATGHGSAWSISTIANGTTVNSTAMYWANNGFVGVNTTTPKTRFVVANSNGDGFEVDPSAGGNFIQSYNRNIDTYSNLGYKALSHTWYRSTDGATFGMTLSPNGTFSVGTPITTGGSGNTLVDSRVIISGAGDSTMLHLQNGTAYAGLKIKAGPMHASSGGVNYYDLTTRPADNGTGVAQSPDRTMIRFEASQTLNPRLLLQPTGGNTQVIVGKTDAAPSIGQLVVNSDSNHAYPSFTITGKNVDAFTLASADIVISRSGSVSSTAGQMPWIQLESSDSAFAGNNAAAIGAAANSLEIWNYVANQWVKKLSVASGTTTSNNSVTINSGSNIALIARGSASNSSNIILQANQAFGVAHWITSKTNGFFHIGANGADEQAMAPVVIAPSSKHISLHGLNETQATYSYGHGGTISALHVNNSDTTANAQAHLFLATGQTNIAGSAIGTVSFVMPNVAANGTARIAHIGGVSDALHTLAQPQGRIEFATKNSTDATSVTRLRIRASGNVTLGATMNDTARLYIYNEARNVDGVRVDMSDVSTNNSSFVSHRFDTTGYAASFLVGANFAGAITHPSATTTNYGTGSDQRIKKNIVDAPSAAGILSAMRVVSHDFIADDYHVPFGFVAQELNRVYPQAVFAGDDGPDIDKTSKIWQVDNSKIVPLLVKQIQEDIVEKKALQSELNAVKDEVSRLRQLVEQLLQNK